MPGEGGGKYRHIDHNGHVYPGHSAVYDGLGNEISNFEEGREQVETVTLAKTHLTGIREKLKFLDDKDEFIVK